MAAGKGERLRGLTQSVPKALVQIAGKTLLEYAIERFQKAGISNITISIGWKSEMVLEAIAQLEHPSEIHTVEVTDYEIGPLRTLTTSLDHIKDQKALITPVDLLVSSESLSKIVSSHRNSPDALVTLAVDFKSTSGSPVSIDSSGRVLGIQRQGKKENTIATSAMFMVINSDFVDHCKRALKRGATNAAVVLNNVIDEGHFVQSFPITEKWFDLDTIQDILEANRFYLESAYVQYQNNIFLHAGDTMEIGNPLNLDSGTVIEKGVCLKGPCFIDRESHIGEDSIIGPYASIGRGTVIGNQCEIQDATLFRNSHVPDHSKYHSIVMNDSTIFKTEVI